MVNVIEVHHSTEVSDENNNESGKQRAPRPYLKKGDGISRFGRINYPVLSRTDQTPADAQRFDTNHAIELKDSTNYKTATTSDVHVHFDELPANNPGDDTSLLSRLEMMRREELSLLERQAFEDLENIFGVDTGSGYADQSITPVSEGSGGRGFRFNAQRTRIERPGNGHLPPVLEEHDSFSIDVQTPFTPHYEFPDIPAFVRRIVGASVTTSPSTLTETHTRDDLTTPSTVTSSARPGSRTRGRNAALMSLTAGRSDSDTDCNQQGGRQGYLPMTAPNFEESTISQVTEIEETLNELKQAQDYVLDMKQKYEALIKQVQSEQMEMDERRREFEQTAKLETDRLKADRCRVQKAQKAAQGVIKRDSEEIRVLQKKLLEADHDRCESEARWCQAETERRNAVERAKKATEEARIEKEQCQKKTKRLQDELDRITEERARLQQRLRDALRLNSSASAPVMSQSSEATDSSTVRPAAPSSKKVRFSLPTEERIQQVPLRRTADVQIQADVPTEISTQTSLVIPAESPRLNQTFTKQTANDQRQHAGGELPSSWLQQTPTPAAPVVPPLPLDKSSDDSGHESPPTLVTTNTPDSARTDATTDSGFTDLSTPRLRYDEVTVEEEKTPSRTRLKKTFQRILPSGWKEIHYENGTVARICPDRTQKVIHYSNGDQLLIGPDGKQTYKYAATERTDEQHPDGRRVVITPDTQCTVHPDGSLDQTLPDGSTKHVAPDGRTSRSRTKKDGTQYAVDAQYRSVKRSDGWGWRQDKTTGKQEMICPRGRVVPVTAI